MEQQHFSTSKVTVEYYDPQGVYKLIAPGLIPRLPLRSLHWQSHAGPLRSIDTLHVELVPAGADTASPVLAPGSLHRTTSASTTGKDDGFQTQSVGGKSASAEQPDAVPTITRQPTSQRRHQIPGLRRTPYLKILLVRCDDSESYKGQVRAEIREWIKANTPPSQSTRNLNTQENHDAFEWLIVHVVIPNTVASTQPRSSGKGSSDATTSDKSGSSSRWRSGSSTLLEKLRADFNGTSKSAVDRVAQIRIGINDVPYDILPRVVPAVPSGYVETEQDADIAWQDLVSKLKDLILSSFDMRVLQYEEDIKEKDAQRVLPGWNFCTFFILKEGLARGFESVGLVEDALVGYDELSVGLDSVIQEQAIAGDPERHGGALLGHTKNLKEFAEKAMAAIAAGGEVGNDEEAIDLQSKDRPAEDGFEEIPISAAKKPYRDMILANNVSVFDFRCYIFSRQISLLLRLGNAWSTREELLAKLKEQQDSVLHGVAPRAPPPKQSEESENLTMLAEICRRTLEFIPAVSQIMRKDVIAALSGKKTDGDAGKSSELLDPVLAEVVDNMVASFAFAVTQQILAQTSTKSLPIPPSTLAPPDGHEPKASIPEPKTMMHPARSSSLNPRPQSRPPPSPGMFPGPGRRGSSVEPEGQFLKAGLEDLAARRAELYTVSRNLLEECGKKRGWSDGWTSVPTVGAIGVEEMKDIDLDDDTPSEAKAVPPTAVQPSIAGIDNLLLQTALENRDDFYRLYETLTDKALRHYTVASHTHAVQANNADLAVLKFHLGEFGAASTYFYRTVPFFGESGWSLLELSMLILYTRCLEALERKDDYVKVGLKLLTKAAAAEKDLLEQKAQVRIGKGPKPEYPDSHALKGFIGSVLEVSRTLQSEATLPLNNFFTDVEIDGPPEYDDGKDSFTLRLKLRSLLVDEIKMETARLRLVAATGTGKEIWVEASGAAVLRPGRNVLPLKSNSTVPGKYTADQLILSTSNILLHFERDPKQLPGRTADVLRHPDVSLYQRTRSFDIHVSAANHTYLDRNNALDIKILPGWNSLTSCAISIKPATGGLRLLMTEAATIDDSPPFVPRPDGGGYTLNDLPADSAAALRIPYTVEQDSVINISVRVEASYKTEDGSTFFFSKTASVPIALALGVNVQDVFKHKALFSRFNVSTASASPLKLLKSELLGSEVFEPTFGVPPSRPVVVFPKQPASLFYKIMRKDVPIGPRTTKTLYLKLHYSVLIDEIEALIGGSLNEALIGTPLAVYSRTIVADVVQWVREHLSVADLEHVALLGEVHTGFLADVAWDSHFPGLSAVSDVSEPTPAAILAFMKQWQKAHPKLAVLESTNAEERRIITIPVDVPSLPVIHTTDIQLLTPLPSPLPVKSTSTPVVSTNQLLPASLRLQWSRIWSTADPNASEPLEFTYEVSAPPDTWLLGGRRRGHFVVSADASKMEVPLLLVPLREGWLPYPIVEIRKAGDDEDGGSHCEVDHRNLGETVRVVADREKVTLSLDASGPGGGPLVLESERRGHEGRVVA